MFQLIDEETGVIHQHDGLRAESYFTACERGEIDRPRPRYAALHANCMVTCLWCAAGTRRNTCTMVG
jgi:hypothetical protein